MKRLLLSTLALGSFAIVSESQAAEVNTVNEIKAEMIEQKTKETHHYRVQKGDTLSLIAKASQTSMMQLMQLNHLTNPNVLTVNQTLTIKHVPLATTPVQYTAPLNSVSNVTASQAPVQQPVQNQAVVAASGNSISNVMLS